MKCAGRHKPPDLRGARLPENKQGFGKARNPRNYPRSPAHQPCPLPLRGSNWHPAHCSSAPAARKWSDARRAAVPPTPRAPAGNFYPRPSNKPSAAGSLPAPHPRPHLPNLLCLRLHLCLRPGTQSRLTTLLLLPETGGSPASGRGYGRARRWEGAFPGACGRGRSGRRALGRERYGVLIPTEVGRGSSAGSEERGGLCRLSTPTRGSGACGERADCRGRNPT